MSRLSLAARITISEANSIPVVRRSSRGSTSRRMRAHPAVGVADAGAEEEVEDAGEDRVADVAVQPRHRAGLDVVHPVADHDLGAVVELGDEARDVVEVVGQVGVGHHDVVARAPRRSRPGRRCRSRGAARGRRARRRAAASSALPSSEPLSATIDLAGEAALARARRARARTHSSMFSASLRQGITTETIARSRLSGLGVRGCRLDRAHRAVARRCWRPASARDNAHGEPEGRRAARRSGAWSGTPSRAPLRICLVYDCLYPYTVGGAERWYRNLARAARGRGPRGHLPDAAPVAARHEPPACRACA